MKDVEDVEDVEDVDVRCPCECPAAQGGQLCFFFGGVAFHKNKVHEDHF